MANPWEKYSSPNPKASTTGNKISMDARFGELGQIKNKNGTISTEYSITENVPELGGWVNVPTLVKGQEDIGFLEGGELTGRQLDIAINRAIERVKGGASLPSFASMEDAVSAAKSRTEAEKMSPYGAPQAPWDKYEASKLDPTMMDKVGDFFSGNLRETEQQSNLPELQSSGILGGEDAALTAAISPALLTATDPNEIAQIISSNFPNVGVTYNKDKQGNVYPLLVNNETGAATIINRPGMSTLDVMQGIGISSAYAPASKAAAIPVLMAKAAATETGIQGVQSVSGGEFNPEEVAISAIGTGAGELAAKGLGKVAKNIGAKLSAKADDAVSDAAIAEAARLGEKLSPEAQSAQQTELLAGISQAATAKPKQQIKQLKELSGQPSIDPGRLAAAESLGVADELMPSQLGRNQSYIEIEQGLASIPGSQLSAQSKTSIEKVAQTADNLIEEFGGTTEKAQLSMVMKDQILKSIDDLDEAAGIVYDKLNKQIPKDAVVDTTSIRERLLSDAKDLGGVENLEAIEKNVLSMVSRKGKMKSSNSMKSHSTKADGIRYSMLDKERKKVGEALRKSSGPYKDESTGTLKRLYGILTETQEQAIKDLDIEDAGLVSQWDAAKQLVIKRKELEDNSILLLGKDKAAAIMPKIGQSMKKLTTGDYKDFDNTMKALPPELREQAVVSALNDVFTMGSRKEKQLSAPGFVDWYKGAKRNGSLNRVEKYLPEGASKRLNDIYKVAEGMRNASAEKITTGRINSLLKEFGEEDGIIGKVYQVGKRAVMAEGATSSMGVPGVGAASVITQAVTKGKTPLTESADVMLSSPAFKRAAMSYAESSGASTSKQKAAEKALEKSASYQKWLSVLPSKERQDILRHGFMTWLATDQANQSSEEQPNSTK